MSTVCGVLDILNTACFTCRSSPILSTVYICASNKQLQFSGPDALIHVNVNDDHSQSSSAFVAGSLTVVDMHRAHYWLKGGLVAHMHTALLVQPFGLW